MTSVRTSKPLTTPTTTSPTTTSSATTSNATTKQATATTAAAAITATSTPEPTPDTDGLDAAGSGRRLGGLPAPTSTTTTVPTPTAAPRRGLSSSSTSSSSTLPAGLSSEARATITAALDGSHGDGARSAVRNLLGNADLKALSSSSQATLLDTLADDPDAIADSASAAARLLSSSTFRAGTPTIRTQMVDVHAAADPEARSALVALSADQRLVNRDFTGNGSALTHLHALATGPIARGVDRASVVSSTLTEIADPSTIEQLGQATCVPTSVSLEIARRSPAEYARLAAGLASPEGSVRLKDGTSITRAEGSIESTRSGRSPSERLIQDAFMEFGNGRFRYDPASDSTIAGDENLGSGLSIGEAARLQSAVFGERYNSVTTQGRGIVRDATQGQINAVNLRNALDRLTFKRAENQPINRLRDEVASGQPTLAALRWSSSGPDAFHAVTVDRIADDRVYFRNPHGGAWHGEPAGTTLGDPPRRFEGGNVESMPLADFRARLDSVTWPR